MFRTLTLTLVFSFSLASAAVFRLPNSDFNGAEWGIAPDAVRQATAATGWAQDNAAASSFPKELSVTAYRSNAVVAGYKAIINYYFWSGKFFQATVKFDFNDLAKYDINYNVYKSVSEYYQTIRGRTLVFVNDCYNLLTLKYGPKKPWFEGLDPRNSFGSLDAWFDRESWNLRYHPLDYYNNIKTQSYARWDFPQTSVIFSIRISVPDKRFDYSMSFASVELTGKVNGVQDSLRMRGM